MSSRLTVALGLVVLALLAALYGAVRWGLSERDTATQERDRAIALEKDNAVLVERASAVQGRVQQLKQNREKADAAVTETEQGRTWAAAPVPDPVRAGLCSAIHCKN